MRAIKIAVAGMLAFFATASLAQVPQVVSSRPSETAAPVAPAVAVRTPGGATLDKADVDAWLDGYMPSALRAGDIAGAVVVVVKDGRVLTQRGYGYADLATHRRVDPSATLFRPGSVSKLFTWTAVMQQVEQGRINLDADVNTYLDFKIPPRDGKPVTMRQIMTHTAGFEDHAKNLVTFDATRTKSLGDYLKAWIPNRIYAPSTTPAYSNYATTLAGYIVQRVSGEPFADYVEHHIFRSLGMTNSTFRQPLPPRLVPMMSSGYRRASLPPEKFEIFQGPEGAASSTGADMARFMIAHLADGALGDARILRPETARMMHDTPITIVPPLNRMELGFFETNMNGHEVIGHLGDTQFFHTALHLWVPEHVGLFLSVNSAGKDGAAGSLRTGLLNDFADRYFPTTRIDGTVDAKTAAEHARMMVGQWQGSRRVETGLMHVLGLVSQAPVSIDGKGGLVIPSLQTAAGVPRRWTEIGPFLWREVNGHERLAAVVKDGKVVRWSVDSESPFTVFDRVPPAISTAWLLPLLYFSLAVLLLTFLHWPAAAFTRRRYKAQLALRGAPRAVYRGVRLAAGLTLVVLIGWAVTVSSMLSNLTSLSSSADPVLWLLQIAGVIVFVGAVVLAATNLVYAFREGRRWPSKLWAVLLLIATLTVLYVAANFSMIEMTVNY